MANWPSFLNKPTIGSQEADVARSIEQGLLPPGYGTKTYGTHTWKGKLFLPTYVQDPILGAGFVTSSGNARMRAAAQDQERLRFLREQSRRGRLATILVGGTGQQSASGGFQLGRKTLLGS